VIAARRGFGDTNTRAPRGTRGGGAETEGGGGREREREGGGGSGSGSGSGDAKSWREENRAAGDGAYISYVISRSERRKFRNFVGVTPGATIIRDSGCAKVVFHARPIEVHFYRGRTADAPANFPTPPSLSLSLSLSLFLISALLIARERSRSAGQDNTPGTSRRRIPTTEFVTRRELELEADRKRARPRAGNERVDRNGLRECGESRAASR